MIGLVTAPETPNGLRLGAVCCLADASYSQVRLERDDAINDRACRADSEKRRRSRILTRLDLPVFTKRWSIFFRAQLIPCYVLAFGKERIRHAPGRESATRRLTIGTRTRLLDKLNIVAENLAADDERTKLALPPEGDRQKILRPTSPITY